jgi:tRNA threonylcarbamoyladenosine biosynthesis protein TsaB
MERVDSTKAAGEVVLVIAAAGLDSSVAVAADDRVLAVQQHRQPHGQAEALLPLVEAAMQAAQLPAAAIDMVAAEIGPGSFTGIRVGLAAARGIALATGARLAGISSFEAAAAAAGPADSGLLVALESRREDLYVQLFDAAGEPLAAPAAVLPAALPDWVEALAATAPLVVAGDAAARAAAALGSRPLLAAASGGPAAVAVWRAVQRRRACRRPDLPARPFYLRPPDVTPAGRGGNG